MNFFKKFIKIIVLFMLFNLFLYSRSLEAGASTVEIRIESPDNAKKLNYFYYETEPNKILKGSLSVVNNVVDNQYVQVYSSDVENTEDGTLIGKSMDFQNKLVGTWIKIVNKDLNIEKNRSKKAEFEINVPSGLAPGDYFGFINIEPGEQKEKGNGGTIDDTSKAKKGQAAFALKVKLRFSIAVWIRVPGQFNSSLKIEKIEVDESKGKLFFKVSLKNEGNVFLKPISTWSLKDKAGEEILSAEEEKWGSLIPGANMLKLIPVVTKRPLAKGDYDFNCVVNYGGDKTVSQAVTVKLP